MEIFEFLMDIIGAIVGTFFVILLYKQSSTLIGSFFKGYYSIMIIASIIFAAGFLTEFLEVSSLGKEFTEVMHHIALVIAGVLFIWSGIRFPKEAEKIMK